MTDYDERKAVADYLWQHQRARMTDFELEVDAAAQQIESALRSSSPRKVMATQFRPAKKVMAELAGGREAFRQRVAARLIRQGGRPLPIPRCPVCKRVLHHPQAEHCLWCGHDWHTR